MPARVSAAISITIVFQRSFGRLAGGGNAWQPVQTLRAIASPGCGLGDGGGGGATCADGQAPLSAATANAATPASTSRKTRAEEVTWGELTIALACARMTFKEMIKGA
jgi:hypothetical protein